MTVAILERVAVKEARTTQAITIDPTSALRSVIDMIHEHGHTGYPVIEDGNLVGLMSTYEIMRMHAKLSAQR